jgi:hypothetical protein
MAARGERGVIIWDIGPACPDPATLHVRSALKRG